VCELSSSTHLRGAQEGGPGRQAITISRRGILAPAGRRIRAHRPQKRGLACQGNVGPVALKTSDHAPGKIRETRGCAATAFGATANRRVGGGGSQVPRSGISAPANTNHSPGTPGTWGTRNTPRSPKFGGPGAPAVGGGADLGMVGRRLKRGRGVPKNNEEAESARAVSENL
jgi:hypothetical protein